MTNQELISAYLESKALAWSHTTLRSEAHRLHAVADSLNGNPKKLWKAIEHQAPYSRVTTWTRVVGLYTWAIENGHLKGPNAYSSFRKENARQFKSVYTPKLPRIGFEDARARISSISESGVRSKALQLLLGGLRYTESFSLVDGHVVGKGGKERESFAPACGSTGCSYSTFLRVLKSVGLTPHALRKICATELARKGLREAELCEAMGWESFATAKSYVAANKAAIAGAFQSLQGGSNDDREKQVS